MRFEKCKFGSCKLQKYFSTCGYSYRQYAASSMVGAKYRPNDWCWPNQPDTSELAAAATGTDSERTSSNCTIVPGVCFPANDIRNFPCKDAAACCQVAIAIAATKSYL